MKERSNVVVEGMNGATRKCDAMKESNHGIKKLSNEERFSFNL
jgi:hypothetical protein